MKPGLSELGKNLQKMLEEMRISVNSTSGVNDQIADPAASATETIQKFAEKDLHQRRTS